MNGPKVSIIVPVHNASKTVDKCIKSIIEQSYKNVECILVENGSNDASGQICQNYAELYDCIKYAVSPSIGVSAARNLGLSIATGDIIGFCDADDFLESEAIQNVALAFLDNPGIVGVMTAFYIGKEEQNGMQKHYKGVKRKMLTAEDAILLTLGNNNVMGSVWNRYYLADIAKKVLFDTTLSYCEDTHYNVRLLSGMCEARLAYIQQPIYCYVMNSESATHQSDRLYNKNGELKYIITLKRIMQDCSLSRTSRSVAKMAIVCLAIDHLYVGEITDLQKANLKKEIKQKFWHWVKNIARFDFVGNVKRFVKLLLVWMR